ncbi:50S ribosomal protein L34e [Candidatus Woesearchaeota archaeon]|nr:50S ribosomal protein L34e [Candidatus Woesearchaeota archaeon]
MPRGMYRSRTFRRIFVKVPGNTVKLHYRRRKPSKAKCANCKKLLIGVPHELPLKMKNMPKTAKRPERPYGGMLCSACTRQLLKQKARGG